MLGAPTRPSVYALYRVSQSLDRFLAHESAQKSRYYPTLGAVCAAGLPLLTSKAGEIKARRSRSRSRSQKRVSFRAQAATEGLQVLFCARSTLKTRGDGAGGRRRGLRDSPVVPKLRCLALERPWRGHSVRWARYGVSAKPHHGGNVHAQGIGCQRALWTCRGCQKFRKGRGKFASCAGCGKTFKPFRVPSLTKSSVGGIVRKCEAEHVAFGA